MNNRESFYLASLLHDIGKFKQRAFAGDESKLSRKAKEMEGILLPPGAHSNYTHRHALWTYDFFVSDLTGLVDRLPHEFQNMETIDEIGRLAASHHLPNVQGDQEIIQTADRLSAAGDRVNEEYTRREKIGYENNAYLKIHLKSIFNEIYIDEGNKIKESRYGYNLKSLSSDSIYPFKLEKESADLSPDYKSLWSDFTGNLSKLPGNMKQFLLSLTAVLEKYTWCIPSATNDSYNDISLYDHSATTAAIALAVKMYSTEMGEKSADKKFLVVAGDISGIQNFIFQNQKESYKGNSKIVRGRSFYISILGQLYYHILCEKTGTLPYTQLINAGGKFIALFPNTGPIREKISAFTADSENWFFREFHGSFSMVTAVLEAGEDDFRLDMFNDLMARINSSLANAKLNKFSAILSRGGCVISIPYTEEEVCPSCRQRPTNHRNKIDTSDVEEKPKCDFCFSLYRMGDELAKSKYFSISTKMAAKALSVFDKHAFIEFHENERTLNSASLVYALGDSSMYPAWVLNNYVPIHGGSVLDFEEIADSALSRDPKQDEPFGTSLLSFIKIDADSMGATFAFGLDKMSVSRYAALSRMLNLFFNLCVREKLKNGYKDFYTVLSGGDDLFLIAPWNRTLDFVEDLDRDFKSFVCCNREIHFSAGVELSKPRAPMNKISLRADACLADAKEKGRKRLKYMGQVIEFSEIKDIHEKMKWLIGRIGDENSPVKRAFLYRMLGYTRLAKDFRESGKNKIENLEYISQYKYDVARNIIKEQHREIVNHDEVDWLLNFFNTIITARPHIAEIIVKIVLYETRNRIVFKEE